MCIEQGKRYIYQIFIKFKCELYHITHMCLGLTDEFCQFEKSLREIWYGTSRNDMSAVSPSQYSTSQSCSQNSSFLQRLLLKLDAIGGEKLLQGGEKAKKVTNPRRSWQGQPLRPGGRGCNIFWFLVQQNNPTTELGWGAFQKDLHHLSNFLLAGRIFENHAQSSQYLISWGRRFWTADLPKYPFDFLLNKLNLKLN